MAQFFNAENLPYDLDIRLVAVDMDETLLDAQKNIPDQIWSLIEYMQRKGIVFAPASGRQFATLSNMFTSHHEGMIFIAENGAVVRDSQKEISFAAIDRSTVLYIIDEIRKWETDDKHVGLVLCGSDRAFIECADREFSAHVRQYYNQLEIVDDLTSVREPLAKAAVYHGVDVAPIYERSVASLQASNNVAISGKHWADIMAKNVDKGSAVRVLQQQFSITPEQTVTFGDYLNDVGLMKAAYWSFAMENAHPDLKKIARFIAPPNTQAGVISVLQKMFKITELVQKN